MNILSWIFTLLTVGILIVVSSLLFYTFGYTLTFSKQIPLTVTSK